MDEMKEVQQEETTAVAPVVKSETNLTFNEFSWLDSATVGKVYKTANMLSQSPLAPDAFRNKPASVLIAMEMADRMKMSLMVVMQNLYVVQGKPAWSGAFCITAINGCGKFSPIEFDWILDDKGGIKGCQAKAKNLITGNMCLGAPVTWETVEGFGWNKKSGSMWNIPGQREQMYMYRAAAYFARTFCPEVLSGLYTVEEQKDISGKYDDQPEKVIITMEDKA